MDLGRTVNVPEDILKAIDGRVDGIANQMHRLSRMEEQLESVTSALDMLLGMHEDEISRAAKGK